MISKIILGTVQFGLDYGINNSFGKPDKIEVNSILNYAFDQGVRYLDTAEVYGNAHELIGDFHRETGKKFEIITKLKFSDNYKNKCLKERLNQVLLELDVEHIYCFMFHSFDDLEKYSDVVRNDLKELVSQNKIKKIGVSIYTNDEFDKAMNFDFISVCQLPFNLFDNRCQREVSLCLAKSKNIEIHTRSVFLQGLFFKSIYKFIGKLRSLKEDISRLNEIQIESGYSMNQLALSYVVNQKEIDHVLIGVDNVLQLKQNIESIISNISPKLLKQINSIDIKNIDLLDPRNWSE